ncbi:MAG: hypothetical protein V4515_14895 [Chloroflexota bacterium]
MIDVVYAMGTENVNMPTGSTIPVHKGTHWPASDPVVKARPALFTSDPRYGLLYTAPPPGYDDDLNEVEEATANPGEKRSVRRS